jgi:hypothetical protein
MTVEESKDALQLGQRVGTDIHDRRLVCLYHGHGARGWARVGAAALVMRRGRSTLVMVHVEGSGRLLEGRGGGRRGAGRGGRRGRGRLLLQVGRATPLRHEGEHYGRRRCQYTCRNEQALTHASRAAGEGDGIGEGSGQRHSLTSLRTPHDYGSREPPAAFKRKAPLPWSGGNGAW